MTNTPATRPDDWMAEMRPPSQVMRLARMGSFHQCRLSFMRALLRRLKSAGWRLEKRLFEINDQCEGRAVYTAHGPDRSYSLVAFAHDLPDEMRSDRVIATAWDCTFALHDGIPDAADLDRLQANVPLQEAGRVSTKELSLSRANRSARMWSHVVERLSVGQQPDAQMIDEVGYLMRTTAVYGSGKFGAADRVMIADRPMMADPFRVEMLSVYLTREFVTDLVEHAAKVAGGDCAVALERDLRRRLGIGNSTGLGMAPFLSFHPALMNNWIASREEALRLVRSVRNPSEAEKSLFLDYMARGEINLSQWTSRHPIQIEKLKDLNADLPKLRAHIEAGALDQDWPWDALVTWSEEHLSLEGQEHLVSILMEPYGHLVDDLASCMKADEYEAFRLDGMMTVGALKRLIETHYGRALGVDYDARENCARFWYVSEEKLEPRLGERFEEPGAEYEQPQNFARDVDRLMTALAAWDEDALVADMLMALPKHRHILRRVQLIAKFPYGEIQDNLIAAEMLPIDMLRCKLSFFGATKFDPRSDRWVRICMYKNAPYFKELDVSFVDDWAYPELPL